MLRGAAAVLALAGIAAAPITGGELDDGDLPVVAILGRGAPSTSFCTGTLIGERVVVTAAHCAVLLDIERVVFGSAPDDPAARTVAVADVRIHAAYDRAWREHDVALLLLAGPAPTGVTPWPIAPAPLAAADVGAPLRVVGFGFTGPTPEPPRKRTGWSELTAVTPDVIELAPAASQPCFGDSGGPAFVTRGGVELLIGVTSHGDDACAAYAVDVHLPAYVAGFIEPYLAATAPGAAGPGERCFTADGCAAGTCHAPPDAPGHAYCAGACADDGDCDGGMRCDGDACRHPLPSPGARTTTCAAPWDCESGVCSEGVCTIACSRDLDCDGGERCVAPSPDRARVCAADPATGEGGGCRIAGGSGDGASAFVTLLAIAALLAARRVHRRPHVT
jgi:hypothetical protein